MLASSLKIQNVSTCPSATSGVCSVTTLSSLASGLPKLVNLGLSSCTSDAITQSAALFPPSAGSRQGLLSFWDTTPGQHPWELFTFHLKLSFLLRKESNFSCGVWPGEHRCVHMCMCVHKPQRYVPSVFSCVFPTYFFDMGSFTELRAPLIV